MPSIRESLMMTYTMLLLMFKVRENIHDTVFKKKSMLYVVHLELI